jgi:zeaxanthin epoxidase
LLKIACPCIFFVSADYYETGYKVYIGPQRYFVTSDVGNGRIQWYAFFALPPGTKKAPSGWGGTVQEVAAAKVSGTTSNAKNPRKVEDNEENLVQYIKRLHTGWSDEIMTILDSTPPESVEQRDLYDRAPEIFRSWADGNVVLIGDAVHAMMPNLGQGGCQAVEDGYVLSEILSKTTSASGIEGALQDFYQQRIVRVSIVQFLSKLASDLIINVFDTPWSPHDKLGMSWKSYLCFFWKPFLQFLIFPAQFAYLYSYHPTGRMGDLPEKLVLEWSGRHKESAEDAFAAQAAGNKRISGPSFFQKEEKGIKSIRSPQVLRK